MGLARLWRTCGLATRPAAGRITVGEIRPILGNKSGKIFVNYEGSFSGGIPHTDPGWGFAQRIRPRWSMDEGDTVGAVEFNFEAKTARTKVAWRLACLR